MADNYAIPLSTAARRHDITAVVIDDPHEYALPDVGWLAVVDSESGRESVVNTSDPAVRQIYARAAEQRALYRKQAFEDARVEAMHISPACPYMDEIMRFFKSREKRKKRGFR